MLFNLKVFSVHVVVWACSLIDSAYSDLKSDLYLYERVIVYNGRMDRHEIFDTEKMNTHKCFGDAYEGKPS